MAVNDGAATRSTTCSRVTTQGLVPERSMSSTSPSPGSTDTDRHRRIHRRARSTTRRPVKLFTDGKHSVVDIAAHAGVSESDADPPDRRGRPALPRGEDRRRRFATARRRTSPARCRSSTTSSSASGSIALLVGTFIIYNTFTMIVAQRQRELALLRAIGADRKQIRRSVVFEALVIGVLGQRARDSPAASASPTGCTRCSTRSTSVCRPEVSCCRPRTVIIALVVGILVTCSGRVRTRPARREDRRRWPRCVRSSPPPVGRRTATPRSHRRRRRRRRNRGRHRRGHGQRRRRFRIACRRRAGAICTAAMLLAPVFSRWIVGALGRGRRRSRSARSGDWPARTPCAIRGARPPPRSR